MSISWTKTPLFHSRQLSERVGCQVYLKLENLQPSQSFKYRGMLTFIQSCISKSGPKTHLYCPSGGNAGLACAAVAGALKLKCTVCIPLGNSRDIVRALEVAGAEVVEKGERYSDSLLCAREMVERDPNGFFVPAYEDPLLWEGHSSMITEIKEQLGGKTPKAIFCSVGGGGLIGGILVGTEREGWSDVPIIALETDKSACFYHSLQLNRRADYEPSEFVTCLEDKDHGVKLANLMPMSKASSLGASSPAAGVVKMALDREGPVRCATIPDEFAMDVSLEFTDLHKFLVELACGTALSPAFNREFFERCCPHLGPNDCVVFICCGGVKIGLDEMREYRELVRQEFEAGASYRRATLDGKTYNFS